LRTAKGKGKTKLRMCSSIAWNSFVNFLLQKMELKSEA